MAGSVFSEHWHRVAELRLRLKPHARVHRQRFRGADWFVIEDAQSGKCFRASQGANRIVMEMTGERPLDEIWRRAVAATPAEADPPTQDDVLALLGQLHAADLLSADRPPNVAEIGRRGERRDRQALLSRIRNPLALRMPLFDPDPALTALAPLARAVFSPLGLVVWLALVGAGVVVAALNWATLAGGVVDQGFLANNFLIALAIYPAIKAIHELAHGLAVKRWGGEVRETGLMFLVLVPAPYVDATAAAAFGSKWRRAAVGAAGMMAELAVAGVALLVWATVEPGVVRAAAFNAALIGGISTIFFNGNPLLRFDGYFMLSDLVEIPNLAQRANAHTLDGLKKRLFGVEPRRSQVTAPGEAGWFYGYAIAALGYRLLLVAVIALFVAEELPLVGAALAAWLLATAVVWPMLKAGWWLTTAPELQRRRGRAVATSAVALGCVGALAFAVPAPLAVVAEGVAEPPEAAVLRAGAAGFVAELAPAGAVAAGATLWRLEHPELAARRAVTAALRGELAVELAQLLGQRPTDAGIVASRLDVAASQLADFDARLSGMTGRTQPAGLFVPAIDAAWLGAWVERGALIGYLLSDARARIRVAAPDHIAELVRARAQAATVRFADRPRETVPGRVVAETPKTSTIAPSAALLGTGGGALAAAPAARAANETLEPFVEFIVEAPVAPEALRPGIRAEVRFDLGAEPLGFRALRALRQLLLRRLDV